MRHGMRPKCGLGLALVLAGTWSLAGEPARSIPVGTVVVPRSPRLALTQAEKTLELRGECLALRVVEVAGDRLRVRSLRYRGWVAARDVIGVDEAADHLAARPREDVRDPFVLNMRGLIRAQRGDAAGAIADFGRVLALSPGDVQARVHRSAAYALAGEPDRALADADEAVRLAPGDVRGLAARGHARGLKGQLEAAVADFDEALRLDPGNAEVLALRA